MTPKRLRRFAWMAYLAMALCGVAAVGNGALAVANYHFHRWGLLALNLTGLVVMIGAVVLNFRTLRNLRRTEEIMRGLEPKSIYDARGEYRRP